MQPHIRGLLRQVLMQFIISFTELQYIFLEVPDSVTNDSRFASASTNGPGVPREVTKYLIAISVLII